jgi:putative transposase
MRFDPERHHRRSIRWRGWDYGWAGAYFVTLCVQERLCLFGGVVDGEMRLSVAGMVVESWWGTIPARFPRVELDAYVVMPNHVHGILVFKDGDGDDAGLFLGRVVQWFKTTTQSDYRLGVRTEGWEPYAGRLGQRNYYEHVVRDERDLDRIRGYIGENPGRWAMDEENPAVGA